MEAVYPRGCYRRCCGAGSRERARDRPAGDFMDVFISQYANDNDTVTMMITVMAPLTNTVKMMFFVWAENGRVDVDTHKWAKP